MVETSIDPTPHLGNRERLTKPEPNLQELSHRLRIFWIARIDDDIAPTRGTERKTRQTVADIGRSEEHTSELQSHLNLVCRLLLEKKKKKQEDKNSMQIETMLLTFKRIC